MADIKIRPVWRTAEAAATKDRPASPPSSRSIALLTLLGAAIFLAGINLHPVGRDEAVSLLLVRHPLDQIVPLLAAHEVHPAGYFLLLWAWPHATPLEARLLSLLPAVACIPVTWLAAARLGLRRPWLAGLLAATSPFLAYESEEARMYTWLALFGAVVLLAVAALPDRLGRRWAVGLGVLLAAGMYLHYFAAFTALGVIVLLLVRRHFATATTTMAVAVLLFLPGLLLLLEQAGVFLRYPTQSWQERLDMHGIYSIVGLLFGGSEYDPDGRRTAMLLGLPALYGVIRAPRRVQLLFAFGAGLPLLIGLFSATLTARYLAPMAPLLLVCLALAIQSLPRRLAIPGAVAAILLSAGLVVYADVRYDTLKPPTPELLAAARAANAEFVVGHRHFAPQAAYYAPGQVAFVFPPSAVDHVGLWAMPPSLAYPPAPGEAVLAVDYCDLPPPIPSGYRVVQTWPNPGANFCAWLAEPPP
jgi:Dolichyl-phosphate-mannose-protein mannosyltransferase